MGSEVGVCVGVKVDVGVQVGEGGACVGVSVGDGVSVTLAAMAWVAVGGKASDVGVALASPAHSNHPATVQARQPTTAKSVDSTTAKSRKTLTVDHTSILGAEKFDFPRWMPQPLCLSGQSGSRLAIRLVRFQRNPQENAERRGQVSQPRRRTVSETFAPLFLRSRRCLPPTEQPPQFAILPHH